MENAEKPVTLEGVARQVLATYEQYDGINRIGEKDLPSQAGIVEILEELLAVMYPGFHGRPVDKDADLEALLLRRLERLDHHLRDVIARTLEFCARGNFSCSAICTKEARESDREAIASLAARLTTEYLVQLPEIRNLLARDIQAAFEGDPAATSTEEIILCYPGVQAISVHRLAHPLFCLGVPLIPRIMNEWAHHRTGVDIHPGARIGPHFFIDHGTGVVIGETTRIGERVKLYQGVTLGALSFPRNPDGTLVKGGLRHPTIGDGVTVYANATILGGETTIGDGAVIGGGAWITKSVAPGGRINPAGA
jgi:serine O-acetyltransferase